MARSKREFHCVGTLEVVKPNSKPVGFLCGSIPVPTDNNFHAFHSSTLLVPSLHHTVSSAPRYRMLPTETDLNTPPLLSNSNPTTTTTTASTGGDSVMSNFSRKCEGLAVSGLVEYGDEIDVISPADILKQIFKLPYSKARLSIGVHRIGQTLVLNTGPDVEEGEKFIRRHNQSKCADQSLFLNFAMHSARVEACDCPPTNHVPSQEQSNSSILPGRNTTHIMGKSDSVVQDEGLNSCLEYPQVRQDGLLWESKKNNRRQGHHPVKKVSQVCEMPRCSMQESEKDGKASNDEFLRVLFWRFHNFRMLLGSDLMLFSNENYVAVSLHLWDVTRQVTPLTWLEAWLDNVMASVPELAICYHENGVVQGYELLKTDDIFLLKGISEDGTPAFHPYVVQQNGLSVLRFIQENCKQDPGVYWLYKSAGEDVIQLFDLSVIPKNHSSNDCDDASSSLPTVLHTRSDSLYSLGTLLYRIAHRLSLSMAPNKRARCVRFLRKCLDFLDEPDHLVVRAFAHEQFARLVLNYDEKLDLTSESLPVESKVTGTNAKEESLDFVSGISESIVHEKVFFSVAGNEPYEDEQSFQDLVSEASVKLTLEENLPASWKLIAAGDKVLSRDPGRAAPSSSGNESFAVCKVSPTPVHTVADPISSKLAAVHHVSQAISSLRRMRQLQSTEIELEEVIETNDKLPSSIHFSVCACGDADCIEVCNIREWLPTSKLDHKLWKLVFWLGESYLALGQAYKEDGQLHQALKVAELACSIYGSMPQHLEDTRFISSMISCSSRQKKFIERNESTRTYSVGEKDDISNSADDSQTFELFSSTYLFWAKAWTLVGDVYVELHMINGKEISIQARRKSSNRQLRMSSEVAMEVERLKKKLGQHNKNCSSCSLVNCSFQSDRASSGSSASSSNADMHSVAYGKKQTKKSHAKSMYYSLLGNPENDQMHNRKNSGIECRQHTKSDKILKEASYTNGVKPLGTNSKNVEGFLEMHDVGSTVASQTETAPKEAPDVKIGSIFKYLGGPLVKDAEHNLLAALSCYEEARKALGGLPSGSTELQFLFKKKGWVCNELGRNRLARKELNIAEDAFAEAINAFRVVSDHTNIILINCNLGHGRRSLAEEIVSNIENLKIHAIFRNAYNQALESAKLEYSESLRYYGAAKSELNFITKEADSVTSSLRNEVYTQFANTYLRLGMLLAKEDETAKVYENGAMEDTRVGFNNERKGRKELRKHEVSANDAIREALCVYESLGELHKQEAAYAYFQLACYQRDCCLKFLESDHKKNNLSKGENSTLQRVKQYASLAERNWQRAMEFYGPVTHPSMYVTILMERSALTLSLSGLLHSNAMLESALSCMLEGHRVSDKGSDTFRTSYPEIHEKFWKQLQMLLKKILAMTISASANKSAPVSLPNTVSNRSGDAEKLRELYKMSLKFTDMSQLHAMHVFWTS